MAERKLNVECSKALARTSVFYRWQRGHQESGSFWRFPIRYQGAQVCCGDESIRQRRLHVKNRKIGWHVDTTPMYRAFATFFEGDTGDTRVTRVTRGWMITKRGRLSVVKGRLPEVRRGFSFEFSREFTQNVSTLCQPVSTFLQVDTSVNCWRWGVYGDVSPMSTYFSIFCARAWISHNSYNVYFYECLRIFHKLSNNF